MSHGVHESRRRTRLHPDAPKCPRTPRNAPEAPARRENRRRRALETPPNAPQCPQMPPRNPVGENEPTAAQSGTFRHISTHARGGAVDTVLHRLTPVDACLPHRAIWKNEPTAAHDGPFSQESLAGQRPRESCNAMQRHATPRNRVQPIPPFGKTNPPLRFSALRSAGSAGMCRNVRRCAAE